MDNNLYRLSQLRKTSEFGGKLSDFSIRIENRIINDLNIQLNKLKVFPIPIKINDTIYEIKSFEKTPGTVKSDFHALDVNDNEILWISHKHGSKPSHFQQYGGFTEKGIVEHEEVKTFINEIKSKFPNGIPKGYTIGKRINDETLKNKSAYGVNFEKEYGRQNVTCILQGDVKMVYGKRHRSFLCNHILTNPSSISGDYEPIMVATFRTDRQQFSIPNCRFMFLPIKGRNISLWI